MPTISITMFCSWLVTITDLYLLYSFSRRSHCFFSRYDFTLSIVGNIRRYFRNSCSEFCNEYIF